MAVDEASGVISHIQADFADRPDSVWLPRIVAPLHPRLLAQNLPWRELAADTGYSNGVNYALLAAQGITPWIPVFGKYKSEIKGFSDDAKADSFTCLAGKQLPFKNFHADLDGRLGQRYPASASDCRLCAHKPTCAPNIKKRQLMRTAYAVHYQRARTRQQSRPGQYMRQLRQRTGEPVFGSLLHHYGLRRVNTRGRSGAHKTMLLAAIAFNLKKLLKHQPTQTRCLALALPIPAAKGPFLRCWRRRYPHLNRLGSGRWA